MSEHSDDAEEPPLSRQRGVGGLASGSALRQGREFVLGIQAARAAPIEGQAAPSDQLTTLLSAAGVEYVPIDGHLLAAARLYEEPARRGPGTIATLVDAQTLQPSQVIVAFDGEIWDQPVEGRSADYR